MMVNHAFNKMKTFTREHLRQYIVSGSEAPGRSWTLENPALGERLWGGGLSNARATPSPHRLSPTVTNTPTGRLYLQLRHLLLCGLPPLGALPANTRNSAGGLPRYFPAS